MIDITDEFFSYANTSKSHGCADSIINRSQFLQMSSSIAYELASMSHRLKQLQTLISKSGRLNKQQSTINRMFMQYNQVFKEIDYRIDKLAVIEFDGRISRSLRQTFKKTIIDILKTKYFRMTLRYKHDYDDKMRLQAQLANRKQDYNGVTAKSKFVEKSHFLQQQKEQLIEQTSKKQYEQIEKAMVEITHMLKHSAMLIKLQQMTIDSIDSNAADAVNNVTEGRRNISEIHKREESNRYFIIRVFIILYVFVFIYVDFLL